MPDEPEAQQTQETQAQEKPQVSEPSAPKPRASAKTPEQQVAEVRSIEQRKAAAALKRAEAAEKNLADVRREHAVLVREMTILREGGVDEDTEARVRRLAKLEDDITLRGKQALEAERLASMRLLHMEYGIPIDDLESYDSPEKMENAALRWALEQERKAPRPKDEEPEPEPKPAERPGYARGTGSSTIKSVPDMSKEEFAAYSERLKAGALAKMARRGA